MNFQEAAKYVANSLAEYLLQVSNPAAGSSDERKLKKMKSTYEIVCRKFAKDNDKQAQEKLDLLKENPSDKDTMAALENILAEKAKEDQAFRRELELLTREVFAEEERYLTYAPPEYTAPDYTRGESHVLMYRGDATDGARPSAIRRPPTAEGDRGSETAAIAAEPAPETPKTLVRYPNIDCPDKLMLKERFSLSVQLLVNPPKPDVEDAYKILIEDKGIPGQEPELEIVVLARGFDIEGSNTKVLKIDRNNDSDERFVLIPKEIGDQQIRVDFYQYGRRIGTERRNVLVTEKLASADAEVKQPISSSSLELKPYLKNPPIAPDLELCVELDQNDGRTLYFRLHSIKEDVGYNHARFGSVKLMGSPLEKMKALYEELTKIAENPGADAERRTAALGNDLWRDLIPDELKREYWRFRNNVQSMLITSDEPWIQWEAIKPYRYNDDTGEREDDLFWCQKFRLSRWLSGPGAADDLPAGEARPVAPIQVDLPSVRDEVTFVEHLGDLNARVPGRASFSDKAQVLDLLEKGTFSVLHFATHGNFDSNQPDNSPILLSGGDLKPSDIHVRFGRRRPRPLIFINACKGAQMDFGFTGLGGWADRLVKEAGVGAFAGAMWSVHDSLAMEFAKRFYTSLLKDNQTIAQAFHTAREAIREADPANSTWLAYVLYADPEAGLRLEERSNA